MPGFATAGWRAVNCSCRWFPIDAAALALALLLLSPLLGHAVESEARWKLVKDKEGIKTYTLAQPESGMVAAKVVADVETDVDTIMDIIGDNAHHTDWVPYLLESRRLKELSPLERLEYNKMYAPWPASNRDFVYRVKIEPKDSDGAIRVTMRSEQSAMMPESEGEGIVRGRLIHSDYRLTPIAEGKAKIEFMFQVDPGGLIPSWVTHLAQRVWPRLLLESLRKRLSGEPDAELYDNEDY